MMNKLPSLIPDEYYHIYNRSNAGLPLFFEQENFQYFLKRYAEYMEGYWDTFGWVLLDDHFHLLVQISSREQILNKAQKDFKQLTKSFARYIYQLTLSQDLNTNLLSFKYLVNNTLSEREEISEPLLNWIISERFRRFLLSYAKAINKQEGRHGSLFQKSFKRKHIVGQEDLKQVLCYIHRNPIHHHYVMSMDDYQWSSYHSYISNRPTRIARDEAIKWFGDLAAFKSKHEEYSDHWYLSKEWHMDIKTV